MRRDRTRKRRGDVRKFRIAHVSWPTCKLWIVDEDVVVAELRHLDHVVVLGRAHSEPTVKVVTEEGVVGEVYSYRIQVDR